MITIEVRSNKLPALSRRFPEATSEIVGKTVFDLYAETTTTSPFQTGNLRGSHEPRFRRGEQHGEVYIAADYAGYQEYGTSRGVRARRWVRDGIDRVVPGMEAAFADLESRL